MKKIVFASTNKHKIQEVKEILSDYEVLSLADIGFNDEIDETGTTTAENSKIKALAVRQFLDNNGERNVAVIADDAGLFVESLNGEPGVYSARYAGNHDDEANRQKILKNMQGKENRTAYFECTICYADENQVKEFTGRTYGQITTEKIGSDAFGYDCLFLSDDLHKTFGQSTDDEKNSVSHRGRALKLLKDWLKNN